MGYFGPFSTTSVNRMLTCASHPSPRFLQRAVSLARLERLLLPLSCEMLVKVHSGEAFRSLPL